MARITVEDCLQKIDSQYDLVMLAKERTSQLNAGDPLLVPQENDKHTVVALREIAEGKVSVKTLEDLGIEKLRKNQSETNEELEDLPETTEDDFDKISSDEKVNKLTQQIYFLTRDNSFKNLNSMGEVLEKSFNYLISNTLFAQEEYFLTLRNDKVNLRQGPSFEYPVPY